MDYKKLTAPCGLDCFNCIGYLANEDPKLIPVIAEALNISSDQAEKAVCKGCRNQNGKIPFIPTDCRVYPCIENKNLSFCYECTDFPCDYLHPYADQASKVPHNTKVFNLCLIKKLGLETWAKEKAKDVKETYDFTTWLFENCDVLNEQIGLTISPIEKENSVGPFNVDILGEDSNGRAVIIENQLTRTDHDHLGKLLTYMSNLDAKVAIWISTDPRPEHVAAIHFLNENVPQDTEFYLLRLQALRIGESEPAPLFTIEAGPSEERTAGGEVKKEFAERDKVRYQFFEQLLSNANQVTNIFNSVSPVGYQNWINAGAGKAGIMWTFVVMKKTARTEFFLCHSDFETNKARYEKLLAHKDDIEQKFGEPLNWDFNDSRKQQYIRSSCPIGGLDNQDKWAEIQSDLIDRLVRLEKSIGPYIKSLK